MATLTGSTIASSYDQLMALPAGGGNGTTLVALTDGNAGNTFALQVSTAGFKSTGTLEVAGITTATGGVVGDLTGDVTGDLTGDVTGDVTGDLTGNVTATSVLADGVVATTQAVDNDSTKVATTAFVVAQVETSDTLAEVLANGNTTGSTNIIVSASQSITTDTISETTSAAGVTIDSVLVKDNAVTATTFTGALTGDVTGDVTGDLTGNADTVTNGVYTTNNLSVLAATTSSQLAGVISDETGSGSLVFATSPTLVTPALGTPASGTLTNCTFPTLNQDTTGTAAVASNMVVADESADTTCYPLFATTSAGTLPVKSGSNLTFNSSSGILTATGFAGDVTGDVTGDCSGTAATVTGATQASITTCANLVTVGTIGTGVWQGTAVDGTYVDLEGTELKSTGETGATKFLREDGDGTSSWQAATASVSIGTSIGSGTSGSVLFVDSSTQLAQDNSNFFWDDSNNRLGIGRTPSYPLDVEGASRVIDTGGSAAILTLTNGEGSLTGGVDGTGGYLVTSTGVPFRIIADSTTCLHATTAGNIGIGTASPGARLDVQSGAIGFLVGGDDGATTRTNSTSKYSRIANYHYTNAEKPFMLVEGISTATNNNIYIGGGSSTCNAATVIAFFTASDNTTATGSTAMTIKSPGLVGIGRTPTYALDVEGSSRIIDTGGAGEVFRIANDEGEVEFGIDSNGSYLESEGDLQFRILVNGNTRLKVREGGQVYGAVTALSEASTVTIDFDSTNLQTLEYTGTCTTLATTNLAAGRTVELRIFSNDTSGYTDFAPSTPSWKEVASSITTTGVLADTYAILKLTSWGTADTDVTAELQVAA